MPGRPPLHSSPKVAGVPRGPHPATVVQPKRPHPATVAQPKAPHPATVVQPKGPHPATVARPKAPHPATVTPTTPAWGQQRGAAQPKSPDGCFTLPATTTAVPSKPAFGGRAERLPHPATLPRPISVQARGATGLPPPRALQRMEADYDAESELDEEEEGSEADPTTEASTSEAQGLYDALFEYMSEETTPFAASGMGRVSNFTLAPSHGYGGSRERQGMKHLAATLLGIVKEAKIKDDEIQIMSLGNVHILTSNNPKSMDHLDKVLRPATKELLIRLLETHFYHLTETCARKPGEGLAEFLAELRRRGNYDEIRFCVKLIKSLRRPDERPSEGIVHDLSGLNKALGDLVEAAATPKAAARILASTKFDELKIILLRPEEGIHAEQNFMTTLYELGEDRPKLEAKIYGSKRACYMCFACLHFASERLHPTTLVFNPNPGQFWSTACASFSRVASLLAGGEMNDSDIKAWFEKFRKVHPKMYFSKRWHPKREEKDDGWGTPSLSTNRKRKAVLSGNAGGNFQSDSESEFSDTEPTRLFDDRPKQRPKRRKKG